MEPINEESAIELFKKYAESIVSRSADFVFLRAPITKAQVIETNRPVPCSIDVKNKVLKVKLEPNVGDKDFPISLIEKIAWGNADGPTGGIKFIQLTIKGDKPIILHGQLDAMELWYDQLRIMFNHQPETETSKAKIDVFTRAIQYANKPFPEQVINIPPPPENYNFVTKLNIE